MPRANFETNEVIQPGTFAITNNANAGLIQANVTYVAEAAENIALGKGGESAGVIKYPPNHAKREIRDLDEESVRLYELDKQMTVSNQGLGISLDDPSIGQNVVDRHMTTRAVAAHQLDSMIGLNSLAEEKFGVDDKGKMFGLSVMADGAGIQSEFRLDGPDSEKKVCLLNVGFESAAVQRGLSDLEVSDYISGQIDRHAGNIFVDQQGKVTGIDNDLAFPSASREHIQQRETDNLGGTINKSVIGMPRQIHAETAQKILAVSPDDMRRMLSAITPPNSTAQIPGRLTAAEIDGACQRLTDLQNELRHPTGLIQVVPEFNMQTYEAALERQKQAFNAVYDRERAGNNRATFDTCEKGADMDACPKTSYLGAMLLKQQMVAIGFRQEEQANALRMAQGQPPLPSSAAIRPLNTAPQAPRNPQYVEYAIEVEIATQMRKENPGLIENAAEREQVIALNEQIAEVNAKIDHYNRESANLAQGKLGARFRSLASGGPEGRKEFYAQRKADALQRLGSLERQLDSVVRESVPVSAKENLMQRVRANAQARHAAQNQAQPEVQAANNGPPPIEQRTPLNKLPPPVAPRPNPELIGKVPNYPAPPPPGKDGYEAEIGSADKKRTLSSRNAEDEQDVSDIDDLDDDDPALEVKKEKPESNSVGDALRKSGGAGDLAEKPKLERSNSIRNSQEWQKATKPTSLAVKPVGKTISPKP